MVAFTFNKMTNNCCSCRIPRVGVKDAAVLSWSHFRRDFKS